MGLKTELLDQRLRVNLAAFKMEYDDIQIQITDAVTRQKFVTNLGSAESEGLELEFSAAVLVAARVAPRRSASEARSPCV